MSPLKLVLAFVPLVAYSVVVSVGGVGAVPVAALVSLALAAVLVGRSLVRRESPKLLSVTAAVVFAVYLVLALVAPATMPFLAAYGRGLAPLVIAATVFVLLPVLPFTVQFARESVPRELWNDSQFTVLNRRLSAVWGGVIAALGICHGLAEALFGAQGGIASALVGWGVPIVLIIAALRWTKKTAEQSHHGAHERSGSVR